MQLSYFLTHGYLCIMQKTIFYITLVVNVFLSKKLADLKIQTAESNDLEEEIFSNIAC